MPIVELFASSEFLFIYSGLLVSLTALAIVRNQISLSAEASASRRIVEIVERAHISDEGGKVTLLLLLSEVTGARILTKETCRRADILGKKTWRKPKTATAKATASYLGAMASLPAERHGLEGLRPASTIIENRYRLHHKGLGGFGDFIVRVALLGTFMGLIAALSIASSNIGEAHGSVAEQSAHMRNFIQALLATAANKFWISAVGIGCALAVQVYRFGSEKPKHIERLGDAFDHALADPETARAWCPSAGATAEDPTGSRILSDAIIARLSQLDIEPLNRAIAATAEAVMANAKDSVISFGPTLSRRGAQ